MNIEKLDPSFALFEQLLGEEFSVVSDEQPIRFELTEVARLKPASERTDSGIRQEPFALLFKELTSYEPDQNTYTVQSKAGAVDLFLVPVGFREYEAVFN